MEGMDNFRERFEALERQTEQLQQHTRSVEQRLRWWCSIACGVFLLSLVSLASPSQAADFTCATGDVACLIDAINTANANGEANTLTLEAGTYTLTAVDNTTTDGPNGLPSVTSTLTIQGAGAEATSIERAPSAPLFRLLHVATTGELTLEGLTIRGGNVSSRFGGGLFNHGVLALAHTTVSRNIADGGGGLYNGRGVVTIARSTIRENDSTHPGGGIYVEGGAVTILRSTLAGNRADGGGALLLSFFGSPSTVVIAESAIVDNGSLVQPGGGLAVGSSGVLVVTNTTIARNGIGNSFGGSGTGVHSFGTSILTNCTVTENSSPGGSSDGGVSGMVALQNTLVALNTAGAGGSADCRGPVTSLGNNLIGDPTSCPITLQPTDRTGDPGLATFRDNGKPGNGHFPLLKTSQAIDAGNDAFCPPTDQLGRRRVDIRKVGTSRCDIGAIEFRHRDNRQHDEEDEHHDKDLAAPAPASQ